MQGDTSPQCNPDLYVSSVASLYRWYAEHGCGADGAWPPLVINLHGWIKGMGLDMLVDILRAVTPTHLVQVGVARKLLPSNTLVSILAYTMPYVNMFYAPGYVTSTFPMCNPLATKPNAVAAPHNPNFFTPAPHARAHQAYHHCVPHRCGPDLTIRTCPHSPSGWHLGRPATQPLSRSSAQWHQKAWGLPLRQGPPPAGAAAQRLGRLVAVHCGQRIAA